MRNVAVVGALYLTVVLLYVLSRMYGGFGPWFLFGAAAMLAIYETTVLLLLPRRFAIERKLSATRVCAQEDVPVALTVRILDRRRFPIAWLRVEELLPTRLAVRSAQPRWLTFPGRAGVSAFRYSLSGVPRGVFDSWAAQISCGDAFGLIVRRARVAGVGQLIVYPASRPPALLASFQQMRLGARLAHMRSPDDASRVIGVRDYVPGDRLSRIHWPATARTGALRSKEFEHHATNELELVVDASAGSFGDDAASFERALSVAASIAQYAHREGLPFGLATFGSRFVDLGVGRGDVMLLQALDHLATLEAGGGEGPADSPWRLLSIPRQAAVILVTRRPDKKLVRLAVMLRERQCRVTLLAVCANETAAFGVAEEDAAAQLAAVGWAVAPVHALGDLDSRAVPPHGERLVPG